MMYGSAVRNRLSFHLQYQNKDANFRLLRHLSSSTINGSSLRNAHRAIKISTSGYHASCTALDAIKSETDLADADFIERHVFKMSPHVLCHSQYHAMMNYYVKKGDVDSVEHIMAEMDRHGLPPNMTTINRLLRAYVARKDGRGARKVIDNMRLHGIDPDNKSMGLLMNAYAAAGDYAATDKILHKLMSGEREIETMLLNDVMRTNVLSKNPVGAESVLSGIYELGFEPNEESISILMKAYASVGDIPGTMRVLERNDQMGYSITTNLVNNILSAIVECPELDHWDEFLLCRSKHFESGNLIPNEETCIKSLLVCAKYGRSDEAIFFFEDFAGSGLKMSTDVRRAFLSAVGREQYEQHPMLFNFDSQNLMEVMDNYVLYQQSLTPIEKPYPKIIDGQTVRDLLQNVKGHPVNTKTMNSYIMAFIDVGDLDGAAYCISKAMRSGTHPDAFTVYLLIGAHASHGNFRAAEDIFADSNNADVMVKDVTVLNQIIRSYGVAGNLTGAEEALKTMPYMDISPNFETFHFMMMNYANIGDINGVNLTIEAMKESSLRITTPCGNYALKAVLHNSSTAGWEEFEECYVKFFDSDMLKKDSMTYTLLMLACQKYDRVDDALAIFSELLASGTIIAPIVKNIFRQIIDSDELKYLFPGLSDSWEPEEAGIHMTKGADLQTNYQEIWGGTEKSLFRRKILNEKPIIRKLPHHLVCGVDEDEKVVHSYGADIETAKKRLNAHGFPARDPTMVEYIKQAGRLGDVDGAFEILMEHIKGGLVPSLKLYRVMVQAYATVGDYMGAEKMYELLKEAKIPDEFTHLKEIIRAYCTYGDVKGAKKTLDKLTELKLRPAQESLHFIMMTHASLGELDDCEKFLTTLTSMKFIPSTTTINILLAAHLYSSNSFNVRLFTLCYDKHFVGGDLVPDRFTYMQLLLACEKYNNAFDAAIYFNKFLETEMRITVAMKNVLLSTLGDEYPTYYKTLSEKNQQLLENVEIVEDILKSKRGNIAAKSQSAPGEKSTNILKSKRGNIAAKSQSAPGEKSTKLWPYKFTEILGEEVVLRLITAHDKSV